MKIIDAFYYNGEVEMLKLRLSILDKYVDQFVVLEADRTFSGIPKSSYWERDKESWKPWEHKIKFYYLTDWDDTKLWELAKSSPNTNGAAHWKAEFFNKEKMKDALKHLDDEDIVFISDCDEIWDPESLQGLIWDMDGSNIWRIKQTVYCYYLNMRNSEDWAGTLLLKYKRLKNDCLNHLRSGVWSNHKRIGNGWHFTSMGGVEELRRKLNDSYTTESYNTQRTQELLAERYGKEDWLDRQFKYWIDESDWPEYLKINRDKYARFIKEV